ncbi:MAG: peptidylprolyl isomerase [Sphaerochaetaceae bacterium]|nr:peptidylprolyl isomerase [Sphaerochaetaceae bacterium]
MNARRILLVFVIALILVPVFSAVGTSPAATVNLIRNEIITYDMLEKEVARYNAPAENTLDVLNLMINDRVFLQGAERDGITVSNQQREEMYRTYKKNYENSVGATISQEEFDQMAVEAFGSVDAFKDALKNQYILDTYVEKVKGDELRSLNLTPSESDINNFYRKNKSSFYMDENVKLAHIFIPKEGDAQKDNQSKTLMNKIVADIKANRTSFEKAVKQYSKDEDSKNIGGDIGWLVYSNENAINGLGESFVDSVFALDTGEVSSVIESNVGYHIVRVSVHNDGKMLNLNDSISPEDSTTVHDYIGQILTNQMLEAAYSEAVDSLVDSLRSEARIRILYK